MVVKENGIVYLASSYAGLKVYRFSGYVGTEETTSLPTTFALEQNYPNPFNPTTTISYALPSAVHVDLAIYDLMGHKVETLIDAYHQPGNYLVIWDASSHASGVYIIFFRANDVIDTKKMVLMK